MQHSFWEIGSPSSLRSRAEWNHEAMESALEVVTCSVDSGHQRDGKRLRELNVVLAERKVQDFVWTWYSECLLRERTAQVLRSAGLTGFEVKPVGARFRQTPERPPKLCEMIVTGWAGLAKRESGIHPDERASCRVCGHLKYTGLRNPQELIDDKQWDGSDFFMVWPMPRYIFASERAVKTIRDHHLTGVRLRPVSDLKTTSGFTPGRLRYYMPEERAHEVGEPLGIY